MDLSISFVFGEAWRLAKQHGLLIAVLLFVLSIVGNMISQAFLPTGYYETIADAIGGSGAALSRLQDVNMSNSGVSTVVDAILDIIVEVGIFSAILSFCRGGKGLSWDSFKRPLEVYLKYFAVTVIVYVLVIIGLCCCILPGIYLVLRLGFAPVYVLDNENAGIGDAIRWAWHATSGVEFELLGLGIISFFVICSGFILCCIGVYFTIAISQIAFVITYLVLLERQKSMQQM